MDKISFYSKMHFRINLLEASLEILFSSQNQCNRNDTGLVGKKKFRYNPTKQDGRSITVPGQNPLKASHWSGREMGSLAIR